MDNPEKPNVEQEPQEDKEFDLNYLRYLDRPITRKDIEGYIISIRPEEFEAVGSFEIINSNGELISIDLHNNTSIIPFKIRPEELMG